MSNDGKQPSIFQNPVFSKSGCTGGFVISSSNNSYIPRPFGGVFGAVVDHGYGIMYIPSATEVVLCLESKRSCQETDSTRFAILIDQSLRDIARIAGVPVANL